VNNLFKENFYLSVAGFDEQGVDAREMVLLSYKRPPTLKLRFAESKLLD
jgi:hypothetical protein